MHSDGVLHGGFEKFLISVGAQGDRALDITGILAAIDESAAHSFVGFGVIEENL
jgi:hypothetical protein